MSMKKMNLTIAKWLYGKDCNLGNMPINFNENWELLMLAYNKFLVANDTWFAVYKFSRPTDKKNKNGDRIYEEFFKCAITTDGRGRMGHGEKFNQSFHKKSTILAMHYSLYRFIENGREY